MHFSDRISLALNEYENKKGIWRRLFSFLGFGKAPAIKALYKLAPVDQANGFQIYQCFIKNMPRKSQASYKVYLEIIRDLFSISSCDDDLRLEEGVISCLDLLNQSNLLTVANFNAIKPNNRMSESLYRLKEASILTQENFDAINDKDSSCRWIAEILRILNEFGILTDKNREALKSRFSTDDRSLDMLNTLEKLKKDNILTQANFDQLLDPVNDALVLGEPLLRLGQDVVLDQDVFDQFIERARQTNPEEQIREYVALLNNTNGAQMDRINNDQSTHTASIHTTVSTAAKKLLTRYEDKLEGRGLEKIILKIQKDLSVLSNSLKDKAAKDCLKRITAPDNHFIDPTSEISIKQLLGLFYLAIHDENFSADERKELFISGLYEIQRGYNLSETNIDDNEKDKPICLPGAFNKLIEKLWGMPHAGVELCFITKEIASLKLPVVVREVIDDYLEERANPKTREDFNCFMKLIEQLEKKGIDAIWDKIKPCVSVRMFEEFKSIYANDKKNIDFEALIEAGQSLELGSLDKYKKHIQSSPGYHAYLSELLWSSTLFFSMGLAGRKNYLDSCRHDSSKAQNEYDQRFGLIMKNK